MSSIYFFSSLVAALGAFISSHTMFLYPITMFAHQTALKIFSDSFYRLSWNLKEKESWTTTKKIGIMNFIGLATTLDSKHKFKISVMQIELIIILLKNYNNYKIFYEINKF
jgi:hypothetical protein